MSLTFDLIIIGAGPGGEACAANAADLGLTVAIIEHALVGGECAYYGCMPSKALLRPAQALAEARRVPGAAEATRATVNVPAALTRRDEVVHGLHDDARAERLRKRAGVTLFRGRGRLAGCKLVSVEASDGSPAITLTAVRAVALCTGTTAFLPPIEGLADAGPWTNREATNARRVPQRLIVLGGGPVGAELAQAFATLGSHVTIVEGGERLLAREEPFASDAVAAAFTRQGITLHLGVKAVRAEREAAGLPVRIELADGTLLEADELLVSAGRSPNTADLGLETVGVVLNPDGFLVTDNHMHVAARLGPADHQHSDDKAWLYALGDVTGRPAFTHTAVYHAQVAARNMVGDSACECVEDLVGAPRVTFTEPQVAAVGHTLDSARAAGINAIAVDRAIDRLAAASFHGRGVPAPARVLIDADSEAVIGATFVGADVAELLHAVTIAIVGEVPLDRLQHAVAPFPTRSEIWGALIKAAARELANAAAQ